jgi:UDP-N-acetylglucosamine 2-epimerase (non-hydrolysing)
LRKILFVFGTRPEAIKMAPVIKEFNNYKNKFEVKVCVSGQHREMLDQVLDFFEIIPDYDLNLMTSGQSLSKLTSSVIEGLDPILKSFKPSYVMVHGDTTTSMAGALASFYNQCKVCHVEAGLRTNDKLSPFPEELNRQLTGRITDYHFAPTETSKNNLIKENISPENIFITGNTVVDALLYGLKKIKLTENASIKRLKNVVKENKRIILVTGHRRENQGKGIIELCRALKRIASDNEDVQIIIPVHLNPKIKTVFFEQLCDVESISLIRPLDYPSFIWLMNKSYIILTDSGGIQEEAPSLNKPVLVARDTTERPEALEAGAITLVGTEFNRIVSQTNKLLNDQLYYNSKCISRNPYGDGQASARIIKALLDKEEWAI